MRPEDCQTQTVARLAGVLYLGTIVCGVFAEVFVRSSLCVSGDAAATAANIMAHQGLYRSGLIADLMMLACYIGVTGLFYDMFKPVSRRLSLVATLFSMIGISVLAAAGFFHLIPLRLLDPASSLAVIPEVQQQALALLSLRVHGDGYDLSLVFFGIYCLMLGTLVIRSGFIPRLVGGLMILAGACYLIDSVADLADPAFARMLPAYVMVPTLLGEGALSLWLILFATRPPRAATV